MRTGNTERGENLRNRHIGVIAVSLVAIFSAALVPVSRAAGANPTSNDFAGYQATSPSAFGSASVEFTVPALQCNQNLGATGDLFGSFVDHLLLGPGEAAVLAICGNQTPVPVYIGLVGGTESSFAPGPGDLVKTTVSMSRTANNATLSDVTRHRSESVSFASSPGPAVAYDGVSTLACNLGSCFVGPYAANFGKMRMFDATLNGVTLRIAGATAVNMQNGSTLEVATRPFNAKGKAWTEVWKAY
jgi:hypothetical protein